MRRTMGQERLNDLTILSFERNTARKVDFDSIIRIFAKKSRRSNPVLQQCSQIENMFINYQH